MITTIIFDYGGVISQGSKLGDFAIEYATKIGKNPEEFKELLKSNWHKARVNDIKSELFWKRLSDYLKIEPKTLKDDLKKFSGFREDTYELIKELKKNNYKLGLLSNHIEDWLEEEIKKHKLDELFDVIVTSYKSKIAKPDISIFKETLDKLNTKGEECVYIDDLEKNKTPAVELKMNMILFKDTNQLKEELRKLSIKIN